MVNDLLACGCHPRQSLTLKYPSKGVVPENLEKDFLRGYFDGDGCLSFCSRYTHRPDRNPEKLYKKEQWIFYVNGTKDFLTGFQRFLPEPTIIKQITSKGTCRIKCGGNRKIKSLMNALYSDANIYLDRKYEKYLQLINY